MILFFITILLSGMVLSQLIEEKSNKIIEVIAAAVPIDALFLGKLFAMLAASLLGIIVWVGAGALLIDIAQGGRHCRRCRRRRSAGRHSWRSAALFRDELSAAGRGVPDHRRPGLDGARGPDPVDAGDLRAGADLRLRDRWRSARRIRPQGLAAAIFPLSSPMAMLARAAERPELWPHAAALLWQTLWVALILHLGAKLFRKTVLKSGPRTRRWWKRAKA